MQDYRTGVRDMTAINDIWEIHVKNDIDKLVNKYFEFRICNNKTRSEIIKNIYEAVYVNTKNMTLDKIILRRFDLLNLT